MDDIQERLEHYEKKDRERKEREAEIMRIALGLFAYAKNTRYTLGDKFYRKFAQLNALILDYGKTYGTEAQERLREKLDVARDKLLARMHGMEEEERTDKMTESYIKQISEDYRAEIERLKQLIEIKDKQIDEYQKNIKSSRATNLYAEGTHFKPKVFIERREINHNEFLAIFKKSVPEENGR